MTTATITTTPPPTAATTTVTAMTTATITTTTPPTAATTTVTATTASTTTTTMSDDRVKLFHFRAARFKKLSQTFLVHKFEIKLNNKNSLKLHLGSPLRYR